MNTVSQHSHTQSSLRDVRHYPRHLLQATGQGVRVSLTYKKVWDDGFGARGWKLNASMNDPQIIASTRETGARIETSVFVHDVLDHLVSGFGVSGHRSEAMALSQLARRTGSDPEPDYRQMVSEDILNAVVNGERLLTFLPGDLLALVPGNMAMSDRQCMLCIRSVLADDVLVQRLTRHFFRLGREGDRHAVSSWRRLGLDYRLQSKLGLAIQRLFEEVDSEIEHLHAEYARAALYINNDKCTFAVDEKVTWQAVA